MGRDALIHLLEGWLMSCDILLAELKYEETTKAKATADRLRNRIARALVKYRAKTKEE